MRHTCLVAPQHRSKTGNMKECDNEKKRVEVKEEQKITMKERKRAKEEET